MHKHTKEIINSGMIRKFLDSRRMDILYYKSDHSILKEGMDLLNGPPLHLPKQPEARLQKLIRVAAKYGVIVMSNQGRENPLTLGDASTQSWILDYYSSKGKIVSIENADEGTIVKNSPIYAIRVASRILKQRHARESDISTVRRTEPHKLPNLTKSYPRDFISPRAKSLGIRIDEWSQNELRFYDQSLGDLLLIWNRFTRKARLTICHSEESLVKDIHEAIEVAHTRLKSERVRVGKQVDIFNLAEEEVESFKMIDGHGTYVADGTTLLPNSLLGSQLMGLSKGMEVDVKVRTGVIRYRVERIY